jgi:hypothetical protein
MMLFKYLDVYQTRHSRYCTVNQEEVELPREEDFETFLADRCFRFKLSERRHAEMFCDLKNDMMSFVKDLENQITELKEKLP